MGASLSRQQLPPATLRAGGGAQVRGEGRPPDEAIRQDHEPGRHRQRAAGEAQGEADRAERLPEQPDRDEVRVPAGSAGGPEVAGRVQGRYLATAQAELSAVAEEPAHPDLDADPVV